MTVIISVQFTLALNPSAGIGRQGILKQYWWNFVNVQVVLRIRGDNLVGKMIILRIIFPGSIPGHSTISSWSSIGRAKYWSYLGCKFKSYPEQRVVMKLVDMNSLGLFD